jgi:hypothetical protein
VIRELMDKGVIVPVVRVAKRGEVVLFRVEVKVPPPGKDWRKQSITTKPIRGHTSAGGATRPSPKVLAAKKRRAAAARHAAAQHKIQMQARAERQERAERKEAAARAAAKARKAKIIRKRSASTKPSAFLPPLPLLGSRAAGGGRAEVRGKRVESKRVPWPIDAARFIPPPNPLPQGEGRQDGHFDDGGFSGQSGASRSFSISSRENFRDPASIPWQRFPADSQFSRLASTPSQNGHVRHCNGRTA